MGVEPVVTEVVTSEALSARVAELGAEISADYAGKTPVVVGVLNAALLFLADLVRAFDMRHEAEFLAVTRFGEGGRVRINMDTSISLQGRDVLLVEDLVDTGLTLSFLRELFETRQVASLRTVTLIDKAPRRIVDVPLEYRGFEVGEEFLLGYGLDYSGRYRNLDSLWAVLDFGRFTADPGVLQRTIASGDRVAP
ncbi:MAG: hypoxanthine phosphoribosyltransferase [Acidimicrobiia bacterium]|nr:hypoxanthine phosphoribosyltransferase [Acidimicrobiia bacterium]NNF68914.1 hypoxanthine phosphoribosyltransferase [Acidimicrobiia bacterium]NNJ47574.1 hypoxanthine phosphoribosyltransferase [Acidimicrobiia bacterium]NNL14578.1 hypoxanthine phosphoribosyltransferase [Acidimicrobiia bacterium]